MMYLGLPYSLPCGWSAIVRNVCTTLFKLLGCQNIINHMVISLTIQYIYLKLY